MCHRKPKEEGDKYGELLENEVLPGDGTKVLTPPEKLCTGES
jgi:hypothetical protein